MKWLKIASDVVVFIALIQLYIMACIALTPPYGWAILGLWVSAGIIVAEGRGWSWHTEGKLLSASVTLVKAILFPLAIASENATVVMYYYITLGLVRTAFSNSLERLGWCLSYVFGRLRKVLPDPFTKRGAADAP